MESVKNGHARVSYETGAGEASAMIEARGLSIEEAAAYAGCKSVSAFRDWVRRGLMPRRIPGTHRYDRRAIDAALDRMSGLAATETEETEFDRWMREREGATEGR